jgi:ectoine hydroxylase-related dioxygenase (phytanoyl-CoA dioxygenase family)
MAVNDFREQVARYEENGYVVFPNVLDAELIADAQRHVDWLRAQHPHLRPENLHTLLVYDDPFWIRLVSDSRLLDIAAAFVGDDIALYASHYIAKPPLQGQPVFWHQDGHYWPLQPMRVVTLWLAITPSVPENGCLRVIPGTHLLELQKHGQRTDVENVLQSQTVVEEALAATAVDVVLQPGDVSVHHPNTLHGSDPNHSDDWRIGLTIRYIPTSTRVLDETFKVMLMRGCAVNGVNTYTDRPQFREGSHMDFRPPV